MQIEQKYDPPDFLPWLVFKHLYDTVFKHLYDTNICMTQITDSGVCTLHFIIMSSMNLEGYEPKWGRDLILQHCNQRNHFCFTFPPRNSGRPM